MSEIPRLILAPLRGVTGRCFRDTFAPEIKSAEFEEVITPFIAAMMGLDPLKDREIKAASPASAVPQFIGKDPSAFRAALERIKSAGWEFADLNCGCPFPMVRNKGRGSGILKTPEVLREMLAAGCEVLGPGKLSIKARLGVDRPDELLSLMPVINEFPLRYITIHARTARQMYSGSVDIAQFIKVRNASALPVVYNGDAGIDGAQVDADGVMVGRAFVRSLGQREDSRELLTRYMVASCEELKSARPVLGRMKELLVYWKDIPAWRRLWPVAKLARSLDEFAISLRLERCASF